MFLQNARTLHSSLMDEMFIADIENIFVKVPTTKSLQG